MNLRNKITTPLTPFSPFQVVDMGDSKVAINEGIVILGAAAITFKKCQFSSAAKPQNLFKDKINSNLFLSVEENDYVCLILKNATSSYPSAEILALNTEELNQESNKRRENKLYKLAKISKVLTNDSGKKYLIIEDLYKANIIMETENWPPFTPILWEREQIAEKEITLPLDDNGCSVEPETSTEEEPKIWNAIFIPGALYCPQTMTVPSVFSLNGVSMLDLPILEVQDGDEFWIQYGISQYWGVEGTPTFYKKTDKSATNTITEAVPPGDLCDTASDAKKTECRTTNGVYHLKILNLTKTDKGLKPIIYWRSDIIIYGWKRCPENCDDSSSSGSSTSDESGSGTSDESVGSDKSTAIVPVSFTKEGYAALFCLEAPEVWFKDSIRTIMKGRKTIVSIDPRFLEVCEPQQIWVSSVCSDYPCAIGAKIKDGKIELIRPWFANPRCVNIELTGVRRGHAGKRFSPRTKDQYIKNEKFINSAY